MCGRGALLAAVSSQRRANVKEGSMHAHKKAAGDYKWGGKVYEKRSGKTYISHDYS